MFNIVKISGSEINSDDTYNKCNLYQWYPFYFDNDILLSDINFKNDLDLLPLKFTYVNFEYPHKYTNLSDKKFYEVYNLYNKLFDYNQWYSNKIGPKNVIILPLSPTEKKLLAEIANMRILRGSAFKSSHLEDLESFITKYNFLDGKTKYMVKMGVCSSKNDHNNQVFPITNVIELYAMLTDSRKLLKLELSDENFTSYVVFVPWVEHWQGKWEFRLFIKNKTIICVSQQHIYEVYDYTDEDIILINKIFSNKNNLKFIDDLPYDNVVCDVYIPFSELEEIYLIECNPFGTSGSALYLYEDAKISNEIRIVV